MFARIKKSGKYHYLQIVENNKIKGQVKQRVIATVGRLDQLDPEDKEPGRIEEVLKDCCVKELKRYQVSKLVNHVGNNSKECIETTDIPKKNPLGAGAT